MIAILAAIDLGIWAFNRHQSRSTVLYYEELEPEVITTLGTGLRTPALQNRDVVRSSYTFHEP